MVQITMLQAAGIDNKATQALCDYVSPSVASVPPYGTQYLECFLLTGFCGCQFVSSRLFLAMPSFLLFEMRKLILCNISY